MTFDFKFSIYCKNLPATVQCDRFLDGNHVLSNDAFYTGRLPIKIIIDIFCKVVIFLFWLCH